MSTIIIVNCHYNDGHSLLQLNRTFN